MAEQGWAPSVVTQVHLQDLMSQGFKIATELATCRVPEDRTSPARAEGYMVAFAVFYEGGGVSCAIAPILPLTTTVIWPKAAQSDLLRELVHRNLCDSVRCLLGDSPPF
jgi:hypothetical protein